MAATLGLDGKIAGAGATVAPLSPAPSNKGSLGALEFADIELGAMEGVDDLLQVEVEPATTAESVDLDLGESLLPEAAVSPTLRLPASASTAASVDSLSRVCAPAKSPRSDDLADGKWF